MKKLSLIAIAALISGAASAAPQVYVRSDLAFDRAKAGAGDHVLGVNRTTTITAGIGINAGGFVIELPNLAGTSPILDQVWLGYAVELGDIVVTPKFNYANSVSRNRVPGNPTESTNDYGLKLEGEYKLDANKSVAAYIGNIWSYRSGVLGPVGSDLLAGLGVKVYF